jgi:azurin
MKTPALALSALVLLGAAALPARAAGGACKLAIASTDTMQFDKKELKVPAGCTEVELTLTHTGKLPVQAMGHNWVLVKTPDVSAVANGGLKAGLQQNYVAADDKRVIAHTKLVGGGQSTSVKFPVSALEKGESYSYICTFPGHSAIMIGKLTLE